LFISGLFCNNLDSRKNTIFKLFKILLKLLLKDKLLLDKLLLNDKLKCENIRVLLEIGEIFFVQRAIISFPMYPGAFYFLKLPGTFLHEENSIFA